MFFLPFTVLLQLQIRHLSHLHKLIQINSYGLAIYNPICAVRTFALDNAASGIRTPQNFALLATNYTQEDAQLTEELLRDMIAKKEWDSVHTAGRDIYRVYRKGSKAPRPKHLLPLLYEYTPCSFCRESALMYMSRHRMVTREILEECLYDSSEDIRNWAKKRLRR